MVKIEEGDLYKMRSPVSRKEIIVEIISNGISYALVDIYVKGKKQKRRRHLDKKNTSFDFDENNLILTSRLFFEKSNYIIERDKIIANWKWGTDVETSI